MKTKILTMLVEMILGMFTPDLLKKFVDMFLDFVENYVEGTASEVDDRIVMPICSMLRETFNIPDDD